MGHANIWLVIRRDAEEASFLANVALFFVALLALWMAVRQANHARKARSFDAFDAVQAKWDRPAIQASRNALFASFDLLGSAEKLDEGLRALRRDDAEAYGAYWALIELIEEIGLLCRSDYLEIGDVRNSIGTGLQECIRILIPHIVWRRKSVDKSASTWANLLWLYETLPKTGVRTIAGYGRAG